jgi:MGT family glycosyltransferase
LASDVTAAHWPEERVSAPLVYASFGTLFNRDTKLFRLLFEALESTKMRAIVSAGATAIDRTVPAPPPNVDIRAWVPQLEILRQSTVCVTRGGMNTVTESLAMGVPLVVIPHMSEQEIVARRVEELGVGIRLGRADLTPGRLSAAICAIVGNERFSRQIAPVRDSFLTAGGADQAVSAIHALVSKAASVSRRDC